MKLNLLEFVGYGVAVKDIEYGDTILHVKPLEGLPQKTGVVDTCVELVTQDIHTKVGVVQMKAIFTDFLLCEWTNLNSNRTTAPDVMYGERVELWREGDSETYYWMSTDIDRDLRTLEHVIIAISNTNMSDRSNKKLNKSNCYIIEMDSRGKKIGIHTNKNDGEPFAYDFQINTGKGFIKQNDDVGNHILMDSTNTLIELINKDLTNYRLDKEDIYEYCKGNRTVIVEGNNTETITGTNTKTVTGDNTVNLESNNTRVIAGENVETINGASERTINGNETVTTPTVTFSGSIVVMAKVTAQTVASASMEASALKAAEVTGDSAEFSIECKAPNI